MKKIFFTLFILSISLHSFAQENEALSKHEIKINLFYTVIGIPEVSYEYALSDESAIGASILFRIDQDIDLKFAATPYYRLFFGKKPTAGFFIEGFGMYSVQQSLDYDSTNDFALGVSVGFKLLTKKGFIGELYGGGGRNLFGNHDIDGVFRFGISIGKRF